jgi:hypothetical protein
MEALSKSKNNKKYIFNFFLTKEEKELIFALKHLHRLNNRVGDDNQKYSDFISEMTCYYQNILLEFKNN